MAHLGIKFQITSRITSDGYQVWGFYVPELSRGQNPNWHTKKQAVESAHFHINLWTRGA